MTLIKARRLSSASLSGLVRGGCAAVMFVLAVVSCLALLAATGAPAAIAQEATAARIQAKIAQVGAAAIKLREAGGDVTPFQEAMQQVDRMLKTGKIADAEKILDGLLANAGVPAVAAPATSSAGAADAKTSAPCDPRSPMTVSGRMTIDQDCTIGGDLTVTGDGVLHFDYTGTKGGRLVVAGNVLVRDRATLRIQGKSDRRAVFVIDNEFSQQRTLTSTDDAAVKLDQVEFRTQKSTDRGKGSVYMTYNAKGRSSFEAIGARVTMEDAWLLAELRDSAKLAVTDTQNVPNEIYVRDASSVKISGSSTRTGVWLDAGGVRGSIKLPDMNGPFSWQIGASSGLQVAWSLQVVNALPGIGIEVKPGTALSITGNGTRAPATGELKIGYYVVGAQETLDGLKAGLQNRKISDRLTLSDVQLGPIAWQIYVGDRTNLAIKNSTINEIGVFGRDAKVTVDRSVLQLATLAALAPGSTLDIRESEIWNQTIEVANKGAVSITDSRIHGTLFHARDDASTIAIEGGTFLENPSGCTQNTMVTITTGLPRCNPFRAPGLPRTEGAGKTSCTRTTGCSWAK